MQIALTKRRENIAEYILYIWQLEDLLRALQMSPEAVYSQLVKPQQFNAEDEQKVLVWYMDIANLLREEDKENHGHIQHTLHLIGDLNNLHMQLMQLPIGEHYRSLFAKLTPELPQLRALLPQQTNVSDIELCFRALYAVMLYRIKGQSERSAITDVLEVVSPVVAELASMYRKIELGEIDLFKNAE